MADERWEELRRLLDEVLADFAGRIEYGDLRIEVYEEPDGSSGGARLAMAYEIPGGSTNQISVSYEDGLFHMLDHQAEDELELSDPAEVVKHVREHVEGIPAHRRMRMRQDIDQWLAQGSGRSEVLEELNRILRLGNEFRGGTLTVEELTDACRYLARQTSGGE